MTVIELGRRFTAAAATGVTFFAHGVLAEEKDNQVPTNDPERDAYSAALDAFAEAANVTSDIPVFTISPANLVMPRSEVDVLVNILDFQKQYNEQFPTEAIDVLSSPYDTMMALILTDIALPNKYGINGPGAMDPDTFIESFEGLEAEMRRNPSPFIIELKMYTGLEFTPSDFANTSSQMVRQGADKCTIFMPSEAFMDTDQLIDIVSSLPLGSFEPLNIPGIDHMRAIGFHEGEHCNPVSITYNHDDPVGVFVHEALADQEMYDQMTALGKQDIADKLVKLRAVDAFIDPTHASSAALDIQDPDELEVAFEELRTFIEMTRIKLNGLDDPNLDTVDRALQEFMAIPPGRYMLMDPVKVYMTVSEIMHLGTLDNMPYAKEYAEDFLQAIEDLTIVDETAATMGKTPAHQLRP